jgi:hypothetical protein
MATSIRLDSSGDVKKAQALLPIATGQLMWIFKETQRTSPLLKEVNRRWTLSDGSIVKIYGNTLGLDPYYQVDIYSPLVVSEGIEEEIYIPLLIFIPTTYTYDNIEGLVVLRNAPHEYQYNLTYKNGVAQITPGSGATINYNLAGVLNTIQPALPATTDALGDLLPQCDLDAYIGSIVTIPEDAEIAMIDWRIGVDYENPIPDRHLYWGEGVVITNLTCIHGSIPLYARHADIYNSDFVTVKGKNLTAISIDGGLISSFGGRHEGLNSELDAPALQLQYTDLNNNSDQLGAIIGMPFETISAAYPSIDDWQYFKLLMAFSEQKALYEKFTGNRVGTTCPDFDYTESLMLGHEGENIVLEEGSYHSETRITGLQVIGSFTIDPNDHSIFPNGQAQFGLNMGTSMDVKFSISGGAGYSMTEGGLFAVVGNACDDALITAITPHCTIIPRQMYGGCHGVTTLTVTPNNGLDTASKNDGSKGFSSTACCGGATWSVSGTGLTIDQGGNVTINPATACGVGTVTATCGGCGGVSGTRSFQITDRGSWVYVGSQNLNYTNSQYARTDPPGCSYMTKPADLIIGIYKGVGGCGWPMSLFWKANGSAPTFSSTDGNVTQFNSYFFSSPGTYYFGDYPCSSQAANSIFGCGFDVFRWSC